METRVPFPAKEQKPLHYQEAGSFLKRIGSTTYRVGVHFSETSSDTAQDIILRLVRTEFDATQERKT